MSQLASVRIVHICPSNHWLKEDFYGLVDHNEQAEVRVAAAYDRPIDLSKIREQVIGAILAYATPAGNA